MRSETFDPPSARGNRVAHSVSIVPSSNAEGMLLVEVGEGRRITLDPFASRVWTEIGDRPTLAALIGRLFDEGSSAERLAEDVMRLLARWRDMGLITWG